MSKKNYAALRKRREPSKATPLVPHRKKMGRKTPFPSLFFFLLIAILFIKSVPVLGPESEG